MDISESLSPRERPRARESFLLHPGLARPRKSSLSMEGGLALTFALATLAWALIWVAARLVG